MITQHARSPCCQAQIIKFGHRRFQCNVCRKTWRARKKKRGRKTKRVAAELAIKLLETNSTVRQRSKLKGMSERQYQIRMARSLTQLNIQTLYRRIPSRISLILLIDGLWVTCEGRRAVIYLMAVRTVTGTIAHLLPPHVVSGSESNRNWQKFIHELPRGILGRIRALVCDGLTGMAEKSASRGWVVQRCQFHYIKTIERFRGKKNRFVTHKLFRERLYRRIRKALVAMSESEASCLFVKIKADAKRKVCPKWIKALVKELLRYRKDFRACVIHPELRLPATNSCMESLAGLVRNRLYLSRGFRTLNSLERWINGFIYSKKTIVCNGKRQPKKRR